MEDMLFNMVPGSRTEPAVQSCFYLSCAAIGFIVMGMVPYMGFTAAIIPFELHLCLSDLCTYKPYPIRFQSELFTVSHVIWTY